MRRSGKDVCEFAARGWNSPISGVLLPNSRCENGKHNPANACLRADSSHYLDCSAPVPLVTIPGRLSQQTQVDESSGATRAHIIPTLANSPPRNSLCEIGKCVTRTALLRDLWTRDFTNAIENAGGCWKDDCLA